MPTLEDLGLVVDPDEAEFVDAATLPRQRTVRTPLVQPGRYTFQLPQRVDDVFEPMAIAEGDPEVYCQFAEDRALLVKPGNIPFRWRTNTQGLMRGRQEDAVRVSDISFLLSALGEKEVPETGLMLAKMLAGHEGERFRADVDWSGWCSDRRDIFKDGAVQEGTKGCGTNFALAGYNKRDGSRVFEIPRDEQGRRREAFPCPSCGARINANTRLQNIKEYTEADAQKDGE